MSATAVRWRLAAGALLSVALLGQPGHALLRAQALAFDSGRAFEHVRQLVAIGPRPAGSAGAVQARRYVTRQLSILGLTAAEQSFVAQTPPGPVPMANLVARIAGARAERLILASHYDTKLFRDFRFVGANDGASSTALLLELARVLRARKNPFTIDLVFFDGEESVIEWTGTDHTYGSRHYVEAAQRDGSIRSVRAMVLFDMVGDRQLTIKRETDSTPWLTDLIWAAARRRNEPAFLAEDFAVEDDHRPFLDAGVPAVNIIDLDYDAWHTKDDTLDRVSARSLQTVADVFLGALPQIEKRLRR
jgi:Zn-dependent M28 family amino/carboxypeptidase